MSSSKENLARHVAAGEIIKPWLILGPFNEDVSDSVQGLTLFEKPGAEVGRAAMSQVMTQAQPILGSHPHEGEDTAWRGQPAQWSLVRLPEKYLSWGTYNISNHLGAAFLSTVVTPAKPGVRMWRLITGITARAVVSINGATVFDTDAHPVEQTNGVFEYSFEAELGEGESVLNVALLRLGRFAQVGCRLEVTDSDVEARVESAKGVSKRQREHIEEELASIRFERDVFYPEHAVGFNLGVAPIAGVTLTLCLMTEADNCVRQVTTASEAGFVALGQGKDMEDGRYKILCTWLDKKGEAITTTSFRIYKATPIVAPAGYDQFAQRKLMLLQEAADGHDVGSHAVIWPEVAKYALGRYSDVSEDAIRSLCDFIAARKDCSDFGIQGLLRLMYWERDKQHLSPAINALMKDTVLGFKYWVDEPGDTVMYMGSENHRFLFHVAEWMAGKLFPTEEFTNSRQRGLYHATKGLIYITEWFRQRGRFGFDEWHSNSYLPVNVAPLLNVYDFASHEGEQKLRQMAKLVADYVFFILAADTYQGIFGTTHGRSYGINLKYPDFEGTSATCWTLFGTGSLTKGSSGMSQVSIASSAYKLPKILSDIALDNQTVVESKQRHGISSGTAQHANFVVYRTPDYMMSGLQDHRKGEYESSTHVAQVTLGNKTCVFWSCPHASGEGSGLRPDYWSGHTTLPRVIQHKNVMSITWHLNWRAWMSHCFFEPAHFDEVRQSGKWVFGKVGKGYVGIYSQNGIDYGKDGQYAGRELQCSAPENTWLVECGREADWGSFDAFVKALSAAKLSVKDGVVTYDSPSLGRFVTGWDVAPTVNGEPVKLKGYPLVDSAWAHAAFGSGELTIRHGDEEREIWFNQ